MLSRQTAQVLSLVRELTSHIAHGVVKKLKKKKKIQGETGHRQTQNNTRKSVTLIIMIILLLISHGELLRESVPPGKVILMDHSLKQFK